MDPSLTILLAEDSEMDVFLMQHAFKSLGMTHPLRVAHNGAEAIDYLAGHGPYADRAAHPEPHCVILDLKMPEVDGFGVLEFLQQHRELAVIPTIVWSGSCDPRDVKHAYCLGANGFVTKPNSVKELRGLLETVLNYWSICRLPKPGNPACEDLKGQNPFAGAYGWTGTDH